MKTINQFYKWSRAMAKAKKRDYKSTSDSLSLLVCIRKPNSWVNSYVYCMRLLHLFGCDSDTITYRFQLWMLVRTRNFQNQIFTLNFRAVSIFSDLYQPALLIQLLRSLFQMSCVMLLIQIEVLVEYNKCDILTNNLQVFFILFYFILFNRDENIQ